MAGLKLDGAGQAKMKTLEDAQVILQRIHGLVEQYALAVKRNSAAGPYMMNLKRQFPALGGLLKGQFGMITDQISATTLQITRGSSEPTRVRQMREGVAQVTQSIEIAIKSVIDKHEVRDEKEQPAGH